MWLWYEMDTNWHFGRSNLHSTAFLAIHFHPCVTLHCARTRISPPSLLWKKPRRMFCLLFFFQINFPVPFNKQQYKFLCHNIKMTRDRSKQVWKRTIFCFAAEGITLIQNAKIKFRKGDLHYGFSVSKAGLRIVSISFWLLHRRGGKTMKQSSGRFKLDIKQFFFAQKVAGHWNRLPEKWPQHQAWHSARSVWTMFSGIRCGSQGWFCAGPGTWISVILVSPFLFRHSKMSKSSWKQFTGWFIK